MGYTWNLDVSNSKISKNPIENVQDQASVGNSFIKRGTAALKGRYQVWSTACYQSYHHACHHHNDQNYHGKVTTRFDALHVINTITVPVIITMIKIIMERSLWGLMQYMLSTISRSLLSSKLLQTHSPSSQNIWIKLKFSKTLWNKKKLSKEQKVVQYDSFDKRYSRSCLTRMKQHHMDILIYFMANLYCVYNCTAKYMAVGYWGSLIIHEQDECGNHN